MITMGCALCREQRTIDHQSSDPLPPCDTHPNRAMVDWNYIKKYPEDELLGEIVNQRYVLVRPLGEGGFGSVYFAIQRGQIRRPVAIKFLTRLDDEFEELFRDEMRVMTRLRNAHVVQFLDSGSHQSFSYRRSVPYMVMEFIEGLTLADLMITNGPLAPLKVITFLRQLLMALVDTHEYGIIHRDLKPLNLMISHERGGDLRLVVLDFGVACLADEVTRDATRNKIMGTPYYLAPEVLLNGEITHQTDLFAAAVIAYEALCFRSPFLNEELPGIEPYVRLRDIYQSGQAPNPLPDTLPNEWELFFQCALSCDPKKRFPSASTMLVALKELEQRTMRKHLSLESETDSFAEDAKTKLFKKQLMKMSKRLQRHASDQAHPDEILEYLSEFESIFESVNSLDPEEQWSSDQIQRSTSKLGQTEPKTSIKSKTSHVKPPSLPVKTRSGHLNDPLKSTIDQINNQVNRSAGDQAMSNLTSTQIDAFPKTREELPINRVDQLQSPSQRPNERVEQEQVKQISEDETLHFPINMDPREMPTIQVGSLSPLISQMKPTVRSRYSTPPKSKVMMSSQHLKPHSKDQSTGPVIWVQLMFMVGLGILFAYVVANYILN
jgi:serine/threonine protein kinase